MSDYSPDFVHHFRQGGRVEMWDDGEVVIYDSMDTDQDDYFVKKQYVPRLKKLILESGDLGRWHHFLKDMVVEDVEFQGSRRKRQLVKELINPGRPRWLIKARAIIRTATRRNPMSKRHRTRKSKGWVKRHGRWIKTKGHGKARRHVRRGRGRHRARKVRSARSRAWTPTMRARAKARYYQRMHRLKSRPSEHYLMGQEELLSMANPRRRRRGRNPAALLRDGTKIVIDGRSATIYTKMGGMYEYDDITSGGMKKLWKARTLGAARKALGGAVLRSINPKRRHGRGRRRNCGYNPPISKAQARAIKAVLRRHGY